MKKIINPFDEEVNMCFGCGRKNPVGLRLDFFESDEGLHAEWQPTSQFQGYPNVLHGGIIATLLDEIGAWCIYIKAETAGVTSEMRTKYLAPVYINKGKISLHASILEKSTRKARLVCRLYDGQEKLCAESHVDYFIYPNDIAVKRLRYPGKEAFYEK
ncbi:MAG: PaaI family thioesterase [Bacteroidales bacterium]